MDSLDGIANKTAFDSKSILSNSLRICNRHVSQSSAVLTIPRTDSEDACSSMRESTEIDFDKESRKSRQRQNGLGLIRKQLSHDRLSSCAGFNAEFAESQRAAETGFTQSVDCPQKHVDEFEALTVGRETRLRVSRTYGREK